MPTSIRFRAIALAALGAECLACGGARGGVRGGARVVDSAPVPAPPAGETSGPVRVRFARGTTSGIVNDSLRAGETRDYLIGAEQGQIMMAHAITWPGGHRDSSLATATVRVYSADYGGELTAAVAEGSLWSGRVPATGDFVVRVSATGPTAYTLAVQIPRRLTASEADPTAAIAGTAPSRAPVDYIIRGERGHTLAASVRESDPVTLHVYGLDDGGQLAPLSQQRKLWAGPLPTSQDYVISVVPGREGAQYELSVALR